MTANLFFMALVFLFSISYTILSIGLSFGSLSSPGPGMLPLITGVMATVISAVLLVTDYRKGEGRRDKMDHPWRVLWFVLSFGVYILIFRPVGYVISTMLFTAVLFLIMENKWQTSVLVGVATGVVFYFVFSLLAVPLPGGILSGLKLF